MSAQLCRSGFEDAGDSSDGRGDIAGDAGRGAVGAAGTGDVARGEEGGAIGVGGL